MLAIQIEIVHVGVINSIWGEHPRQDCHITIGRRPTLDVAGTTSRPRRVLVIGWAGRTVNRHGQTCRALRSIDNGAVPCRAIHKLG